MVPLLSLSYITSHIKAIACCTSSLSEMKQTCQQWIAKSKRSKNHNCQVLYPQRLKEQISMDAFFATTSPTYSKPAVTTSHQMRPVSGLDMPVTPHYIPPRAPIVLCHGLYGFDKRGPDLLPLLQVHYWGGIESTLTKLGAKVIIPRVPSTGSIWERAQTLHHLLRTVLEGKEANLVAHSMGGLDCRHLLSHIHNRPYRIQSLTTISTPHRGSPVMDWFRDKIGLGMAGALVHAAACKIEQDNADKGISGPSLTAHTPSPLHLSLPSWKWTLADIAKMPRHILDPVVSRVVQLLDTPAYANLTTDYCTQHFNPSTPNEPNVAYYSYGASSNIPVWSFLGLPHQIINEKEGKNDGLVSVQSATWGKYIKTLDADHLDLNGQRYRWGTSRSTPGTQEKFNVKEFYLEMATHLYCQGH